jgi:hypothetical protein
MKAVARTGAAFIIAAGCAASAIADDRKEILADEAAFRRTVDESITGDQIAAHPFKYVGKHVDLMCVVQSKDDDWFDVACPNGHVAIDAPGYSPIKTGQRVRIIGVVERPWGASQLDQEVFALVSVRILLTGKSMMERGRGGGGERRSDSRRARLYRVFDPVYVWGH